MATSWEEKISIDASTGCHEWLKAKQTRGYGVVWYLGKVHLAHRVAWHRQYGEWPDAEMVTDHICNNKGCVNPQHLRELPNHLNLRRAIPRGDAETERRRSAWRRADAKRRGNYRYTEGGESDQLVQG